jgi:hypothetical protein
MYQLAQQEIRLNWHKDLILHKNKKKLNLISTQLKKKMLIILKKALII